MIKNKSILYNNYNQIDLFFLEDIIKFFHIRSIEKDLQKNNLDIKQKYVIIKLKYYVIQRLISK